MSLPTLHEYSDKKGYSDMDKVKRAVHYWCNDTIHRSYAGQGITTAILDTGIAPHPDFKGRIVAFKDYINGRKSIYDDCGHGTHVAGILAGDGRMSKGILAGMAPAASLVIVKVLDGKGEGNLGQIFAGIQWIKKNWRRYRIRIVNISVGARNGIDERKEERLVEAVEQLWDEGIIVTVSAGNYGPDAGTITIPGTSRKVITVGADRVRNQKDCSGRGPTGECIVKPDIVAPGYQIISCNNTFYQQQKPYTMKSGSSMATPVVSGALALLLSKYPEMKNTEVKLWMRECSSLKRDKERAYIWRKLNVTEMLKY